MDNFGENWAFTDVNCLGNICKHATCAHLAFSRCVHHCNEAKEGNIGRNKLAGWC